MVAAFLTFGLFWGSWAVMVFNIQRTFHLSDSELGVMLALAVALAGVAGAVSGHLADRVGARRLLWIALFTWAGLLLIMSITQQRWTFVLALVAVEMAGGCIDTAMNAEASHRLIAHPGTLVRFHALFNSGALLSAATAGIIIHAGLSWRWVWPGVAVVATAVGIWALVTDTGEALGHEAGVVVPHEAHPFRRLRSDGLLVLLVIFALAEVTEGGVDTWGVLFLRHSLSAGVLLGAGAYVVGQSVAALTRGAGGAVLGRLSARSALIVGGCTAGGGILLESLTHFSLAAALGLALGAGGASLFWPLVMSTVSKQASQVVSAVGTFTAAGYIGWVAGAPLVGWISQTYGAAHGLQLLAVAAFGVALVSLLRTQRRPRSAGS